MPSVTSVWPGWMATSPLKRRPSTKTGHNRRRTAGCIEDDADPADGVAVDRPELLALGVGRQPGREEADHAQCSDDPAVGTILTFTDAEVRGAEQGGASHRDGYDDKRGPRRIGKERIDSAPARNGEAEIDENHCC